VLSVFKTTHEACTVICFCEKATWICIWWFS